MDEESRFHRTLKNPFVMIGLCLIAGIAVYSNVIEPAMHSSVTPSIAFNPSPLGKNPIAAMTVHRAYEDEATQWMNNPERDPFAPVGGGALVKPRSTSFTISAPAIHVKRKDSTTRLVLKAVALEAQQRSAVINRRVVHEGEMIEGYQVVSIQLQGVWLTRYGKKQFLPFATKSS